MLHVAMRLIRLTSMILASKKAEPEPDRGSWIRDNEFFITSTAFTVFVAVCGYYDAMHRIVTRESACDRSRQTQSTDAPREAEPELEQIANDIDAALGACNSLKNIACVPSLIASIRSDEPVTIETLRAMCENTSDELRSSACRVLDAMETKPDLIPESIAIAKRKLSKLPDCDWRKLVFTEPLNKCEECVSAAAAPMSQSRKQ